LETSFKVFERFFRKYRFGPGDCWTWTAGIAHNGYGKFSIKTRTFGAHRVSYTIFRGEIPKGKYICHSCDNRSCVNPAHLWPGTAKENQIDCREKGRGSTNGYDKMTHCFRGHEFTPENTMKTRGGKNRRCRKCHNFRSRENKRRYRREKQNRNVPTTDGL
jgi:hypothetical protein